MDTTLQRLTDLEGSVVKLEPVPNDAVKLLDVTNGSGTVLNVTGGGKLYAVLNYDANVDLFVDGAKKLSLRYTNGAKNGSYACSNSLKGMEYGASNNNSARYLLTSFGCVFMDNGYFNAREFIVGVDLNSSLKTIGGGIGVTKEPIEFKKSLEIKSTSGTAKVLIAYSLGQ